jgi:hypothetical protein
LSVSLTSLSLSSLNFACSFQISGLALPPSVPAPKPIHGSFEICATTSAFDVALAAS